MKAAVRGLASGDKGYEGYPKVFKDAFIFLNIYCRSVEDEHKPRGPAGPFQFEDRSVPVIVIKRWDGKTLTQKLGFYNDVAAGRKELSRIIDQAVKDNGPILAPKKLKPLIAAYGKGVAHLKKKKPADAIKEFQTVVKLGEDPKAFPGEPPAIVQDAKDRIAEIADQASGEIDKADELASTDAKKAKGVYQRLRKLYGAIEEVKIRIDEALAGLPAE